MLVSALKKGANQRHNVHGVTFEALLASFDSMVDEMIEHVTDPFDGIVDPAFIDLCRRLSNPQTLEVKRGRALNKLYGSYPSPYGRFIIRLFVIDSPIPQ